MSHTALSRAIDALQVAGISWLSFAPAAQGPDPALCADEGEQAGVLLLLSFGGRFAAQTAFDAAPTPESHPFDARSRALALAFADDAGLPARLVYPLAEDGALGLDLRGWLHAAQAQYLSPLGTGIRPDCGPWLAVRAALVVRLDDAQRELLTRRFPPLSRDGSPCDSCSTRPCVRTCPAGAVSEADSFGLHACIAQRVHPESSCALRCHARLACPIGSEFRYPEPLLRYHYGVSLRMLRQQRP